MSPPPDDALRHTAHPGEIVGVSEDVWMEVIDKMDQVYSDLLQYEVALEQKNAKLEESQQFILSVLTSMSDIMLVCDRNGIIQDANRSLEAFCGRSVDALRGTSLFELFVDPLAAEEARRRLFGQGAQEVHDCELPLRARDGSAVPVSLNCTPRFNAVGKSLGMVVTGRPVGELRRAYQALHEAHEDLKRTQQQLLHAEKMASLGRLVAGVAHELNNPISFVLGNVHALQRYASRLAGYLEDFDLVEVVERAVRWVCKTAREDFRVELALPPRIALRGSPGRIQQVVTNLIENARDATTAGDGPPTLRISATVDAADVRMCFDDNGPGIPAEILGRIFDPFFTTKPVGKGTGLGLSISYGIVERHGGTLTAENRPEGGARLVLTLPTA